MIGPFASAIAGPVAAAITQAGAGGGYADIVSPLSLHPAVTFSRSTTGTYLGSDGLLHTAAINSPRYEYDAAGNYLGLLIEEQRTNLLTYSGIGTGIAGMLTGGVTDETVSWLGTFTAAIRFGNNSASRYAYKQHTNTIGVTYVISVFVKMDDGGAPVFGGNGAANDGALVISGAAATPLSVIAMGGGVYRVSTTFTPTAVQQNCGVVKYTNNSARTFVVTGYQLEAAGAESSYIPTTSAAVTRGADSASHSLSGIDTSKGTFYVEHDVPSGRPLLYSGSNKILDSTGPGKVAIAYDASGTSVALNGGAPSSGSALTFSSTLSIGVSPSANANAHIKRLRYYPRRLSNADLQAITA